MRALGCVNYHLVAPREWHELEEEKGGGAGSGVDAIAQKVGTGVR